jgi:PAS domain S-box-containing protein
LKPSATARSAALLIPLALAAIVVLWILDLRIVWPRPILIWCMLGASLIAGIGLIVIPTARRFLANGEPTVLMLGAGALVTQIGAAATVLEISRGPNQSFAIYNTSLLLTAVCHLSGVVIASRRRVHADRAAMVLWTTHMAGVALVALVVWGSLTGRMPAFFIVGHGGTLLRSITVSVSVALFIVTAGLLWQANSRAGSPFLYWYALGLGVLATGLFGSMLIVLEDSPLQWVTRITQTLGTLYLCVAGVISFRDRSAGVFPPETVQEVWWENELLAGLRRRTLMGWGLRCGLALAVVAAAWGLRVILTAWVGPGLPPYLTFYPAIMISALLAGLGPGLLATALSDAIVAGFILLPGGFPVASELERLGLVFFTCLGVLMSAVAALHRRGRDKVAAYDRETALRESRERLAVFAEASFEGIVESEAGRMTDCNEQFARMTGYSIAELQGTEIISLVPDEDRDRVAANIRHGRDSVIVHTVVRKDGSRIVVEAHGRPVSAGSARRHTVIRDITERQRVEQALRESEERSRNIIRFAPAAIYETDIAGERFISVNETICQLLGCTREQLLGMRPRDLLDDEGRAAFQDRVVRKLAGGDVTESVEYRVRALDGRWIEVLVNIGSFTYRDGKPDSILVIAYDITARKRLERMYAVLSRVNESIVRSRDELALCRDVCRIVAEDGGFPLVWIGMVEGRDVRPVASSGTAAGYLGQIKVEVDGPMGNGPTGTCIREDRSVINDDFQTNPAIAPWRQPALTHGFRASAAFPLHREGRPVGALTLYATGPSAFDLDQVRLLEALGADLSYALDAMDLERRRAEAETALRESERSLRESDQRKNEFLAVLSHELRNPLAPIRNSLHILEHVPPGGDQARRAQIIIDRQVDQLVRLVDDLLDLTRVSRNKIRLECQVLELNDLVRRTLEDYRSQFEKNEIGIEAGYAPEAIYVNADGARIAQVVGNLLQNAAKFTGRGGSTRVTVSMDPEERQAVLRVADTGVGMAPEVLARLFEPFVQADTTLDRSKGGLGLGLALVKGLVELHQGSVTAHSPGLGKGSEFVVRLPLADSESSVPQPAATFTRSRRRVLVIEDNIDAADSLRALLSLSDHEVDVAHTGPEGIAKAREFCPDVVLCDIGLPGMDGYEVARAFRSEDRLKNTYLVALSGYALPEDMERAREAGFERHLAKPPDLKMLEQMLANVRRTAG